MQPGQTGLTGFPNRSDRFGSGSNTQAEGRTSPIRKFISMFTGICKGQRDVEVSIRQQRIESKKTRDAVKRLHAKMSPDDPPSPISPPLELPEIPPLRDIMTDHMNAGYFEEYGDIFGYGHVGSSTQPVPPPPTQFASALGTYTFTPTSGGDLFGSSFGFAPPGPTYAAPSIPSLSYAYGGTGSSMAGVQFSSAPSPSPGDFASQAAASIFGPTSAPSHGML